MALQSTADPLAARAALAAVAGRLTGLLRSSTETGAHAVGEWNVADVAVHLGNAWDIIPALARGETPPLIDSVWELAGLTTSLTRSATDHDLGAIADRIDAAAASFLATAAEPGRYGRTWPWLVSGVELPITGFVCHLLNESLVHGWDVARAQGRAWRIEPEHARLVLEGFLFPVLSSLPPETMVRPDRAARLSATYELRIRRGPRVQFAFADGGVEIGPAGTRRVDCYVSADAAAMLLVMWGRMGQWRATASGRLISWGRRPWLGPRLRHLVRNP